MPLPKNSKMKHVTTRPNSEMKYKTRAKLQQNRPILIPLKFTRAPDSRRKQNYRWYPWSSKTGRSDIRTFLIAELFDYRTFNGRTYQLPYCRFPNLFDFQTIVENPALRKPTMLTTVLSISALSIAIPSVAELFRFLYCRLPNFYHC